MLKMILVVSVAATFMAGTLTANDETIASPEKPLRVLVLTGGGYHDFALNTDALVRGLDRVDGVSFSFDRRMLRGEMPEGWQGRHVVHLSDPDVFKPYDAILTYHQGELPDFTNEVRERFLEYIRNGGGLVAIHSSADSFPGWDEYDEMLGGRFESHPPFGEVTVNIDIAER
jgi:hypothetical protein